MNLAVIESMRRKGIARALVTRHWRLGLRSPPRGLLEVRASNQAAQSLYAEPWVSSREHPAKYYTNPIEDAC